jgi:hypothetical protein
MSQGKKTDFPKNRQAAVDETQGCTADRERRTIHLGAFRHTGSMLPKTITGVGDRPSPTLSDTSMCATHQSPMAASTRARTPARTHAPPPLACKSRSPWLT